MDTAEIQQECNWYDVPCATSTLLDWLFDAIVDVPRQWYADLIDVAASLVEDADVPFFVQDAVNRAGDLATIEGAAYLAHIFALREGITLIIAAMVLRYTWSWLPFVGR